MNPLRQYYHRALLALARWWERTRRWMRYIMSQRWYASRLMDEIDEFQEKKELSVEEAKTLADLIQDRARFHCLGHRLYDSLERLISRIRPAPPWYVVVSVAWGILFGVFFLLVLLLTRTTETLPAGAAVLTAVGVAGIYIVRYCYDVLVPTATICATALPKCDVGRLVMFRWIISCFDMKRQVIVACVLAVSTLTSLACLDIFVPSFPISPPSYTAMLIAAWGGGSAVYWLRIPGYIRLLASLELDVFPLDPRRTFCIQEMKQKIVKTLLPISIGFMIVLMLWRWIVPFFGYSFMMILMIAWYTIIAVLFSIYYFGSMRLLSGLVRKGKEQIVQELQRQLQKYYDQLENLTSEEWETLQRLLTIYNQVNDTPETLMDKPAILRYVSSLAIQAIPLLVGISDLPKVLQTVSQIWGQVR